MKRRALLTSMGVGMAGMAGCLGGNSNNGGSTPQADVGPTVAVSKPEGKKAEYKLKGISATDIAEIGKKYSFEVTVENTGGQPGVFRTPVNVKRWDSDSAKQRATAMVYLKANEEKTAEISLPAFEAIGKADIQFGGPNNSWTINIEGPDLAMTEVFEVDGFLMKYTEVEFRDSLHYETGSIPVDMSTGSGEKFAVATVKLKSIDSSSYMAESSQYTVIADGQQKGAETDAGYNLRSLSQGEVVSVELPYRVSADVSKEDLIFRYDGQREDKYARWSPGFEGKAESESDASASGESSSG